MLGWELSFIGSYTSSSPSVDSDSDADESDRSSPDRARYRRGSPSSTSKTRSQDCRIRTHEDARHHCAERFNGTEQKVGRAQDHDVATGRSRVSLSLARFQGRGERVHR